MFRKTRSGAGRRARPARCAQIGILTLLVLAPLRAWAGDPFADAVVSFTPGTGAGFGQDQFPGIVLGPPQGGGDLQGSLDVLSLGNGGSITLAFRDNIICDGPGPDFTVFENAFHAGGPTGAVFTEVGIVAVSQDGEQFVTFPYDPQTLAGLAGLTPVYSNPDNGLDPTDPTVSGGDHFDLADVGLSWVAYVRITDPGAAIADAGNRVPPGTSGGFDLDAIAAIHSCDPGASTPTPSASATSTASVTQAPLPSVTPSPTATASPTPAVSPTPVVLIGDVDGNGVVDAADLARLLRALFHDDDLDRGDVNADGPITAADCPALIVRVGDARP